MSDRNDGRIGVSMTTYEGCPCKNCGNTTKYQHNRTCTVCHDERKRNRGVFGTIEHKRHMLSEAKQRAKRKNIPFELTIDDFDIPERCPVFNVPLQVNHGGAAGPNSASIDRIIPEWGYIKGNVLVISHRANTIKHNANPSELGLVYKFFREKHHELVEEKEVSSL